MSVMMKESEVYFPGELDARGGDEFDLIQPLALKVNLKGDLIQPLPLK
ncbi:hypothetical protein A2U01_0086991, partial [Trifolium medium]|nr:hypothetical protein [Trifolium medium]